MNWTTGLEAGPFALLPAASGWSKSFTVQSSGPSPSHGMLMLRPLSSDTAWEFHSESESSGASLMIVGADEMGHVSGNAGVRKTD